MEDASYYRERALHARRLANLSPDGEVRDTLLRAALEYDENAEDLESGAADLRPPELTPAD